MQSKFFIIKNESGFTIIELMVAMVIFAISLLGMLNGAINIKRISTQNELRENAMKISQETLEQFRSTNRNLMATIDLNKVDASANCNPQIDNPIIRNINKGSIQFGRFTSRNQLTSANNIDNVTFTICWKYRNRLYQHTNSTLVK